VGVCFRCGHNIFKKCDPDEDDDAAAEGVSLKSQLICGCPYCNSDFLR
jgi:hypothetical protein